MSTTRSDILTPEIPGLPSKDVVVRLCKKKGCYFNTLTTLSYSAEGNTFFIKYNNVTMEEAHAQVFFRQESRKGSNATIRIPEVYHAFEAGRGRGRGRGFTYIVMEYIEIDFERTASDRQRAQALSDLISIPPPLGVFGSFSGTYRHHFFQDGLPPVPFSSAAELEDYLNRCLEWYNGVTGLQDKVDFSTEPLLCYYSDIHPSNFPIDKHGQLWVIDFAQTGVLPSSFMSYAIAAHPTKRLPILIRKTIRLPKSSNLGPLGRATYVVQFVHNDFRYPLGQSHRS